VLQRWYLLLIFLLCAAFTRSCPMNMILSVSVASHQKERITGSIEEFSGGSKLGARRILILQWILLNCRLNWSNLVETGPNYKFRRSQILVNSAKFVNFDHIRQHLNIVMIGGELRTHLELLHLRKLSSVLPISSGSSSILELTGLIVLFG
jgi:hypothetical protein